jgi:hypothetical protein
MKKFEEYVKIACAENQVSYSYYKSNTPVKLDFVYHAYKNGEVREFSNYEDAFAFSYLVDKTATESSVNLVANSKEIKRKVTDTSLKLFRDALRAENNHLSDAVFDILYLKAHGNTCSYDGLVDEFDDLEEFVSNVLKAS